MDLDDHQKRCVLRGTWQLASVFHFLNVFRPVLHFDLKFSMEELESALLVPNDLLGEIHIGLLKAIPPGSRNPINRETWIAVLCKKLKEWWHAVAEGPFPLVPQDGDEIMTYKHLSPDARVVVLKALCEARLDQDDMRAFISEMAKQEHSFLSIRKESTGTDMQGGTYWYERDPIAGFRLYRELHSFNGKDKVKHRGHLVSAPAMGHWETLATNLDEFQSLADKLCSSRNKMEVVLGQKINSDIVPDLINAEKKKQRVLKKQLKQASLLDSHLNAESVACSRPRRERKPVSYTFDDYDNSIDEAIDVMKGIHASRIMDDQVSGGEDEQEEIDASGKSYAGIAHSGRPESSLSTVPECDTDTSSGCNNEDASCADEQSGKRLRADSLDASDSQGTEQDMDDAANDLIKENIATKMDSEAAGKGDLHVTKKPQGNLTQSSRVTRSKAEESGIELIGTMEFDMDDSAKLRRRERLVDAGFSHLAGKRGLVI